MPVVTDHKAVLREYYARYLREVRGVNATSVGHYFDALNNISRRLKDMGLVERDIYEIADLETLDRIRKALFEDPVFKEYNERGKRMYSAGLNNYFRFASGEGFGEIRRGAEVMDVPVAPEEAVVEKRPVWKRSGILRAQAIEMAGYACEIEPSHQTFISGTTDKPYMEGHHALPMNMQGSFRVSLDVYANIVCLCPICHRQIHFGLKDDRVCMIRQIYDRRAARLVKSGIDIGRDDFIDIAVSM